MSTPASSVAGPEAPNILLLIMDCVRAKNVGPAGTGPLAETPNLTALGKRGTVFTRAVAPGNWTIPSHMSMFTGVYPSVHGVRSFTQGATPMETLGSWLGRRGYRTAVFTETVHLVGGYGLEAGYAERFAPEIGVTEDRRTMSNRLAHRGRFLYSPTLCHGLSQLNPLILPLNALNHPQEEAFKRRVVGDYLFPKLAAWLDQARPNQPFHACINFADAHEPYDLIPAGRRPGFLPRWYARTPRFYLLAVDGILPQVPWAAMERGYVQSVEGADRKLGRVLQMLEERGLTDRTFVIVTADHGQSFGERGNVFHGCGATDSILRVPLVAAGDPSWGLPARVEDWVSLTRICSWAKASAAGRVPFDRTGIAPLPFGNPSERSRPVYSEGSPASDPNRSLTGVRTDRRWNHRLVAAYDGATKSVLDLETQEIFEWDTGNDPDHVEPRRISEAAYPEYRVRVFGPYEELERMHADDPARKSRVPVSLNSQLVSWGYD